MRLDGAQADEGKAFALYLRTGRRLPPRIEYKFNPYHDHRNGQFTFARGDGTSAGGAGDPQARGRTARGQPVGADPSASTPRPPAAISPYDPRNPANYTLYTMQPGDTLTAIAARRQGIDAADLTWLNDLPPAATLKVGQQIKVPTQTYLDAGRKARQNFLALAHYMDAHGGRMPPDAAHPPSLEQQVLNPSEWRAIDSNGYRFEVDRLERTREVKGGLTQDKSSTRSKRHQREAGGGDRLSGDDGGHYIAVRFNGPAAAFNHFAQDTSFNRGGYRALEDSWARALRGGHAVFVDIVPRYSGASRRPYELRVTWFVDGHRSARTFENGRPGD